MCNSQTEGDLRLVNLTDHIDYMFYSTGRLEIFWNGKWSTLCRLNRASARVACNQMGYFSEFGPPCPYYAAPDYTKDLVSKASDDVPIGISFTECGTDYRQNSALHLLRCSYIKPQFITECSHENDTIIECVPLSVDHAYYNTQVRLASDHYPSSGTLEIHINSTWGNVCNTKFNQQAADSVCRQMGYTNALAFSSTKTKSAAVVWLDGVECGSESCECLNRCFKTPHTHATCSRGEYVTINCTFDVRISSANWRSNMTAGNWEICSVNTDTCNGRSICKALPIPLISGVGAGVGAVIGILLIVIACFAVPSCPLAQYKQRKGYTSIDNIIN